MKNKYVVFDLDDTLVYEIDYLKSAYSSIARLLEPVTFSNLYAQMMNWYSSGLDTFLLLQNKYPGYTKDFFLDVYRNHIPYFSLNIGAEEVLDTIKKRNFFLGLVTDGRSITQRNKLKAIGIEDMFDQIIISEEFGSTKPDERNFRVFGEDIDIDYYYIADNPTKDFIAPNNLGWTTIALKDSGKNIHSQNFDIAEPYRPKYIINTLIEVLPFFD